MTDPRPDHAAAPERNKLTGNGACWITEAELERINAWIVAGGNPDA